MKSIFIFLVFSLVSLSSCEFFSGSGSGTNEPETPENPSIVTGSSFGMCAGYCWHEVTIKPQLLKSVQKGTRSQELPDKRSEEKFQQAAWDDIFTTVDLEKFKALPDVIGCPDCADTGAEWIEIRHGDIVKKVTIEHGTSVPEIQALLDKLRPIRERFKK